MKMKLTDKIFDHIARFYPIIKILTMVLMFFVTTFVTLSICVQLYLAGAFSNPTVFMSTASIACFANIAGIWTIAKISKRYHSKYAQ